MPLKYALLVLYAGLAVWYVRSRPWEALYWLCCFGSMSAVTFGKIGGS